MLMCKIHSCLYPALITIWTQIYLQKTDDTLVETAEITRLLGTQPMCMHLGACCAQAFMPADVVPKRALLHIQTHIISSGTSTNSSHGFCVRCPIRSAGSPSMCARQCKPTKIHQHNVGNNTMAFIIQLSDRLRGAACRVCHCRGTFSSDT